MTFTVIKSVKAALPLVLGALLLTACEAEGPRSNQLYASPRGTIDLMVFASQKASGVPVHAVAAPNGIGVDSAAHFATLINQRNVGITPNAAAEEIPSNGSDPRILLMHDTPDGYTAISACQGKGYSPSPAPDRLNMRVAICYSDARLVEVSGSVKRDPATLAEDYDDLLRSIVPQVLIAQDRGR